MMSANSDRGDGRGQKQVIHILDSPSPVLEAKAGKGSGNTVELLRIDHVGAGVKERTVAVHVVPSGIA